MAETVFCSRCAGVETALRCSRCETPICPNCLIQSPVGARCPGCAQVRKAPMYTLNTTQTLTGLFTAIIGGTAIGFLWAWIGSFAGGMFFAMILGIGLGYAITKLMDVATGQRRGPIVITFAALGIVIAWAIQMVSLGFATSLPTIIAAAIGFYFAYQYLK